MTYDGVYGTVGSSLISNFAHITAWLTSNFIGTMYMFFVLMIFFYVILTLGGKNK